MRKQNMQQNRTPVTKFRKTFSAESTRPHADTVLPNIPTKGREWSVISDLLDTRTIRLDGAINEDSAAAINASIRYLEKKDPNKVIHFIINSEGGVVTDGLAIVDTMRNCRCPIHTYVYGFAASMASVVLVAGNKRYASPNSRIMIHQPWGGAESANQTEMDISAIDLRETRETMTRIYAEESGLNPNDIDDLIERDNYLTPERAKKLGLIDEIMTQELYFKMQHGRKVPEFKKPRYPENSRTKPRKTLEEHFNDVVNRAARRRLGNETNDNKKPARQAKPAPRARKK